MAAPRCRYLPGEPKAGFTASKEAIVMVIINYMGNEFSIPRVSRAQRLGVFAPGRGDRTLIAGTGPVALELTLFEGPVGTAVLDCLIGAGFQPT